MILHNQLNLREIKQDHLILRTLPNGDVFDFMYHNIQINLQQGNDIDGQLSNIYLRFNDDYRYYKLLNQTYYTHVYQFEQGMIYQGQVEDIHYTIKLTLYPSGWTYDVSLSSSHQHKVQLYYGQDIGIQDINGILNNEAYIVQYIDFKSFSNDTGFTLCARQNQGQPAFFQMGMREKTIGYVTDAMQFFTTKQKLDGKIHAMNLDVLENRVYQYESSYLTLQSDTIEVSNKSITCQFYGYFEPHHDTPINEPKTVKFPSFIPESLTLLERKPCQYLNAELLAGKSLDIVDIQSLYPQRSYEEFNNEQLFSFFLDDHTHVMTQQKEVTLERSQGHIILQGDILKASDHVHATTAYMSGVFMSHVSLGNTSFHKMLGDHRNPLLLHRMAGLRLYLKINGVYKLLGMPSLFEVGLQHVTWRYVLENDTLTITLSGHVDTTETLLSIHSNNNIQYEMVMTMQLLMGPQEWMYDIEINETQNQLNIKMPDDSMAHPYYSDLTYSIQTNQQVTFNPITSGVIEGVFTLNNTFEIRIAGNYGDVAFSNFTHDEAIESGKVFYKKLLRNFDLSHPTKQVKADVHMVYWYAHNALIHYASPHGLEQYNGAAWGTRDVCQGPFEFFSAVQYDPALKHILLTVYGKQFLETGDFPQWFMYDKYSHIQAHESHGDIIYWPLKALAYYLRQTGDLSILSSLIPYFSLNDHANTQPYTLYEHVKHQINSMFNNVIHDLPVYGGGDWDDTLQPANQTLKERMVSGWTAALMIQSIESFANEIKHFDAVYAEHLNSLISNVKDARKKHLLPDDIPTGFVVFNEKTTYLLHPRDTETMLSYRLLPLIRSMIAGLSSENQTKAYINIIDNHLKYPDGVRLMDKPVTYLGGYKKHFNRAETAANFGREIGLQYVHAHIRYIEAMLTTGYYNRAYEGLDMVHPIKLIETVKHASPRQRNTYFSSSDGWFYDRYDAKNNFHLLKTGDVPVKGGWRIYSSGPGILIHQIISGIYGIQRYHGKTIINPKLPNDLKDVIITFKRDE